jgi:hypothetical protein
MGFSKSKSSKEESSTLVASKNTARQQRLRSDKKTSGFDAQPADTCSARFWEDLTGTCRCRPNFRTIDGPTQTIDVPASFSPYGRSIYVVGCKFVTLGVAIYTIYLGYVLDPRPFYFAYLTHWGLVFSLAYSVMSVYNSFFPVAQPPPGTTTVSGRTIVTWVLFTIAVHTEVIITLLYWTMLFSGELFIVSVLSHGVVAVLVLVDGLFVNAIPIRLRHWFEFILPVDLIYIIWSVLHSSLVFGLGNPDNQDEDPETNDDLIYTVLDWGQETAQAAVLAVLIGFVLSPVIYLLLWGISSRRRRHITDAKADEDAYMEMTTV